MLLAAILAAAAGADPTLAQEQGAAQAAFDACKGTPVAIAIIDAEAMPCLVLVSDGPAAAWRALR